MVIDYMPGGELFFWLHKHERFSENRAKLYAAEITLAFEALHSANIIYRDLKPENLMLDAQGHIKVTDFGMSKGNITSAGPEGGTKTCCGTPDYMAPEIIYQTGHGKAVDWWALGVLLFEMLSGDIPFKVHKSSDPKKKYDEILRGKLRFPTHVSEPAQNIIRGLLERNITNRLGSHADALDLKQNIFFKTLNFQKVESKLVTPEFIPPLQSGSNLINVDPAFTDQPVFNFFIM